MFSSPIQRSKTRATSNIFDLWIKFSYRDIAPPLYQLEMEKKFLIVSQNQIIWVSICYSAYHTVLNFRWQTDLFIRRDWPSFTIRNRTFDWIMKSCLCFISSKRPRLKFSECSFSAHIVLKLWTPFHLNRYKCYQCNKYNIWVKSYNQSETLLLTTECLWKTMSRKK